MSFLLLFELFGLLVKLDRGSDLMNGVWKNLLEIFLYLFDSFFLREQLLYGTVYMN